MQGFESRKALALLAYLAVQGQPVPRSRLADLFWGDKPEASGRNNLSRVLSNLSTLLPGCLEADRYTVRLNPNIPFELDVAEFETKITQGDAASLAEAANLYRGDFMEGIYLDDCPGVEIWMVSERERRREQAAQALQTLVEHHAWRGQYQEGLAYTARLLALDPWREEAHRQKMLLLARTAQRSAALKQYDKCRRILAEELDVEPSHETKALYERIRAAGEQPRHNLPPQPTPFVGREDELAEIGRLLVNPDCRLLTLAGPGGIGKTRLALQAAGEKIGAFLQGVYFVPLAPVRSAEFLVSAIAEAIAFSFYSREAPKDQLVNYLREKEMLLVLDNFEHLLRRRRRPPSFPPEIGGEARGGEIGGEARGGEIGGEAGGTTTLLAEILQRAPEVKLLVTSRERLNLQEEWVLEVQGLSVPEGIDDPDLERYEAVRLFLKNVRKADLGFTLAEAEKPYLARVCQLVGGLPLGLELAAAWVRTHSCQEVAAVLEQDLGLLTTPLRNVPERHRSLWAVCDHSWRLLRATEQRAFRQLSVFQDSFTREAARAVAGATRVMLTALVDKSLLQRLSAGHYGLHPLLRQYGGARLHEVPMEAKAARDRHCEYYATFLQRQEPDLKGKKQQEALAAVGAAIENIRVAWEWAISHHKIKAIEKSLDSLFRFYEIRGWYQEGEAAFGSAAERLSGGMRRGGEGEREEAEQSETPKGYDVRNPKSEIVLGKVLARQGAFSYRLGFYEKATGLMQKSLATFHHPGARGETAFSHNTLGNIVSTLGEQTAAQQHYQRSITIFREIGDQWGIATALNNLATVAQSQGAYTQAREHYQESLDIFRKIGYQWGIALCLSNLGSLAQETRVYNEANQLFQESLIIRREIGDQAGVAICLNGLGDIAYQQDAYQEARELLGESLAVYKMVGNRWGTAIALDNLGNVAAALGEYSEASQHFQEALKMAMEMQAVPLALDVLVGMASLLFNAGKEGSTRGATKEGAFELLALPLFHPATDQSTRDRAEGLRAEWEAQLPPEVSATAQERGKGKELEEVVEGIQEVNLA